MWIPTSFETKPTTIQPDEGAAFRGTELWVDGLQMSNAVELVRWNKDPIHLKTCTDCLAGDCHDGAWLSVRRAGSYVLFLPSFSRWLEDEWYDQGYEDPPLFLEQGAILLDRALYSELRSLVPELPAKRDLLPLTGWEAVRLLRFEAPVEILGKSSAPVEFQRDLLLGTHWWDSDDRAAALLEQLLETWMDSYEPVALKPLSTRNSPVRFDLAQGQGSVEWQPLASGSGWDRLLLTPGYMLDAMPELPEGEHTNALMVTTHWQEGHGLKTEIRADTAALYDFAGRWLQVDFSELAASRRRDGEYFIITCYCGEAGCAGIHRGVDVYRDDGKVYWVIYQPQPARTLVFDEEAYNRAVYSALAEYRYLCAQHPLDLTDRSMAQRLAALDEPPGGL